MTSSVQKLIQAQQYAFSIRPPIGGFPILAEVLRQAGVQLNNWYLPSCQAIYFMKEGTVVQQGEPLFIGPAEVPLFNRQALITAIRNDQQGLSSFPEFLHAAWQAGVVEYEVNFENRTVTYYGLHEEKYLEEYPRVEVKN